MSSEQEQNNLAIIHIPRPFPHVRFAFFNTAVIYVGYQLAAGLLMYIATGMDRMWIQGFGQALFMLLPAIAVMQYSSLGRRGLLRAEGDISAGQWLLGLAGILPILLFGAGWMILQEAILPESWLPTYHKLQDSANGVYESFLVGNTLPSLFGAYLVGAVIPAFAEEVLFRGLVQRSLEEVWSPLRAVAATGLLFGLVHFFNPVAIVPLVLLGIYFGILAWYTCSLALPIVAHFLNNAISITLLNITARTQSAAAPAEGSLWQGIFMTVSGLVILALILRRLFVTRRLLQPLRWK